MRSLIGDKAKDLGIEPAVLASPRELEGILRLEKDQWPAKFRGWRSDLIGKHLDKIRQECGT